MIYGSSPRVFTATRRPSGADLALSDRNIEIVQVLYAAFGAGDVKAIIRAATAGVTWEIGGRASDFPAFRRREGLEGIA